MIHGSGVKPRTLVRNAFRNDSMLPMTMSTLTPIAHNSFYMLPIVKALCGRVASDSDSAEAKTKTKTKAKAEADIGTDAHLLITEKELIYPVLDKYDVYSPALVLAAYKHMFNTDNVQLSDHRAAIIEYEMNIWKDLQKAHKRSNPTLTKL